MYRIAVLPCDGIGPEVAREGLKVLAVAAEKFGVEYETVEYDIGGDRYLRTGEIIPDSVMAEMQECDAIYLGAVGHADVPPGVLEHGILLRLRFELDQYVNLRPVILYPGVPTPIKDKGPNEINFVVVRENTECLYCGTGGWVHKGTENEVATQVMVYTRKGVERIIRWALEYARKRAKARTAADLATVSWGPTEKDRAAGGDWKGVLHLVDKANVLTYGHDLWRRVFAEVGEEYEEIKKDYAFVDAACMWMVKNPEWFDVIVTCNMFGDIITDLGAIVQGGMGVAASGNINPDGVSMFEPIHGSAPKYTGQNVVCPIAAIAATGMMMEELGEAQCGKAIEQAVISALGSGEVPLDSSERKEKGVTTEATGDLVASLI